MSIEISDAQCVDKGDARIDYVPGGHYIKGDCFAEIEKSHRECPVVIVSPTRDGDYLINVTDLQQKFVGLGQLVQVGRDFNSYEMAEVIGQHRSAWSGAVNVIPEITRFGIKRYVG